MRKYCNEGHMPCPYLDFKHKPKCTKYQCRLAYCKRTVRGLGTLIEVEPDAMCRFALDAFCDSLIDINSRTCPGAENPAMFAENCCASCSWYINKVK